jgi:uncharacterized cofD-like protein
MGDPERLGAKIVLIGGGTGSFTLLSGLKHYVRNITALVNMADDGGSSGQLRDELGILPPGDVRQCLVALSDSPKARDLFNYRFSEGSLSGHTFGNLFLTALEQMTGSFAEGVELASQVLNISGKVEPITLDSVKLNLRTADGEVTTGQFAITKARFAQPRPELWLEPEASLNPAAKQAILEADLVVVSAGNLYGSLAPALITKGIKEALLESKAKKVYVCNLVTKPGQTDGFKVHDFAAEIERFIGAPVLDYVLYNTMAPSEELLNKYAHEGEFGVEIDEQALNDAHYKAKGYKLLAGEPTYQPQPGDALASSRTFIRHDPEKTARQLMKIYFS